MPKLKRTMFREYDIRGRESSDELNETTIYHIARGFAVMLVNDDVREVVVGSDARGTSDIFRKQAVKAFIESGLSVVDIGTVTTPMSYWAQHRFNVRGLMMITASHNPVGWNGVKLGTDLSRTLLSAEINDLYEIIEKERYVSGVGRVRKEDIFGGYLADLIGRVKLARKLKILVNTGNGTAGYFASKFFRAAGCDVVEHYTEVDATYPHYTANPDGQAMMDDTGEQVRKNGCEIGLAFDGDGDRLGVTDEKGVTVWPDRYIALLARLVLQKQPGSKIVFDVKVSESLPEDIQLHGGLPIMWKTGHSHIKSKLAAEKAALAGEMSGHIFFAQNYYGFDDAFFAALKLLEYISQQAKNVSGLVAEVPYYISTPTIQVKTSDEEKYAIVESLTRQFKDEKHRVFDINGARVYFEEGWGLVRASSNTPSLVLRFEAKTQQGLNKIQKKFREKLSAFPQVSQEWDTSGR